MTGYGQDSDRRRSQEAGCEHHLVKPVDPQKLQELLEGRGEATTVPEHEPLRVFDSGLTNWNLWELVAGSPWLVPQ